MMPSPEQKMPEGSWKCERCNNINFPFRTKCNRQNCGADKPSEPNESPSSVAEGTEQVCGVMCFLCAILLDSAVCIFCIYLYKCCKHDHLLIITTTTMAGIEAAFFSQIIFSPFVLPFFFGFCWVVYSLIHNCLLFQWVLGHVWLLGRSRVVVQHAQ